VSRRLDWLLPLALLAIVTGLFLARANAGIGQMAFGDESGHLIGAHAIAAGDRLYRDFIDAHGPVAFIVPWLYVLVFGWDHANGVRWTMAVLAAFAAVAVAVSPPSRGRPGGLWAAALFTGGLASVWTVQGLSLVSYHTMAGCFAVVILASFTWPAVVGKTPGSAGAAAAGAGSLLCCATAYPLVPSVVLLLVAGLLALDRIARRRAAVAWVAGFASAGALVLIWMLLHGDLVGYVVFHFLSMQTNYARYAPATVSGFLASLAPSFRPHALVHGMAILATVAGAALSCVVMPDRRWSRLFALTVAALAVLLLDARGLIGFQDGTFVVAAIAFVALPVGVLFDRCGSPSRRIVGAVVVGCGLIAVEAVARQAIDSPWGRTRAEVLAFGGWNLNVAPRVPEVAIMRAVLDPAERLLVLVYSPTVFLNAGLLPVRGFHEYLPWEADYARHPMLGRARDLCATLTTALPPVIWYDDWAIGDRTPASFIPCLPGILADHYVRDVHDGLLFVRLDRVARARSVGFVPATTIATFGPRPTPG